MGGGAGGGMKGARGDDRKFPGTILQDMSSGHYGDS
jgi:hypothetical protein